MLQLNSYAKQLEADYVKTHEFVHGRLEQMAEMAKKQYDKRTAERRPLQPGEEVLLKNETRRSKLDAFWLRGWVVVRTKGLLVTIQRRDGSGGQKVVNINRVKSADAVRRVLVRDDLANGEGCISHSVVGVSDDESFERQEASDGCAQSPVRRYPLRIRRPTERYRDSDF